MFKKLTSATTSGAVLVNFDHVSDIHPKTDEAGCLIFFCTGPAEDQVHVSVLESFHEIEALLIPAEEPVQ